jgi:DNA-binding SARP family transcriptional activator
MAVMRLSLLGAPQLAREGQCVPLALRKTWGLLAWLVLQGPVARSRIAGQLWPEGDEAAARRNLRRELHRLREGGLADLVRSEGPLLRLAPVDCDVLRFTQALDASRFDVALGLYRGPLLEGVDSGSETFDLWLRQQREHLHSRWQQGARQQVQILQDRGDLPAALATALQVLDVDALQEADYRTAMALHHQLGGREAALALYERCRKALGRDLGLRPMAQTVALAESIRRGEAPHAAPVPPSAEPALPSSAPLPTLTPVATFGPLAPDTPLVGRDGLMAELDRLCHPAGPGQALAFVLLTGPAGVGKTRLAQAHAARRGGMRRHAAWIGDSLVAYAAPVRWLRERGARAATLPAPLHRELSRVLPELDFSGPPPDPQSPRDRLFDALAQAWQLLTPAGAGCVVFDDLQWLDAESLDWLMYLLTRCRGQGPPALCLARSDELAAAAAAQLAAMASAGVARSIGLPPLTAHDTLALVRRLSGTVDGERFAQRLHGATGGHPMFLLETLRHLLDSGWIGVDAQGRWHTPVDETTQDYAELPVPASVREAVLARVARLNEAARRLLEAASCLRRPLRFELIARATALSDWEGVTAFEHLRAAQLMDADEAGRHRFTHDLIAQTVADSVGPERRRLLHRALAQTLAGADLGHELAADVAQHWHDGGEPAQASGWWARAAQRSEDLGALREALALADRALTAPASAAAQARLHLQRARLLRQLADPAGRLDAVERAERAAGASGEPGLIAQSQLQRANCLATGAPQQAQALVDRVLDQPGLPPLLRSAAHQQRAQLLRMQGELDASLAECDTALALLPPGAWRSRAELMLMRGFALMFGGRTAAAEAELRQAADASRRSGDDAAQVKALCAIASIAADRGDVPASRRLCEQALATAQGTHSVGTQRNALLNLVRALVAQGQVQQAQAQVQAALALSPQFTGLNEEQALLEARFVLALMAGELGAALDASEPLLALTRRAGEKYRAVSGLLAPVDAWLLLDSQREAAARLLDEAEACLGDSGIADMRQAVAVRRAEWRLLQGDARGALAGIDKALAFEGLRAQDRAHAWRVQALARHALGLPAELAAPAPDMNPEPATLGAAARLCMDPAHWDEALAWFDGGRAPPLEALHLALSLLSVEPFPGSRRHAPQQRVRRVATALARRLHASLAGHATAQAGFRQQFAALFQPQPGGRQGPRRHRRNADPQR